MPQTCYHVYYRVAGPDRACALGGAYRGEDLRSGQPVSVDHHKQCVYTSGVIRSFADGETRRFFVDGKSRRVPSEIRKRAAMRLLQLNAATGLDDLRVPPSNRLEALHGDRAGRWSIRINDQWRVCFRFEAGDAFDVEIVDYH